MSKYITCDQLISEFLHDYVCAELPPEKAFEFERHLGVCPPCERYLRSYRETIALAKGAFSSAIPESPVPDELVRAILKTRRTGS